MTINSLHQPYLSVHTKSKVSVGLAKSSLRIGLLHCLDGIVFTSDMKLIYNATNREMQFMNLECFAEKWIQKYFYAIQSGMN